MTPDLTDAEVNAICAGLVQNCAKTRYLRRLGLTVRAKPNGKPLVNRAHYDAIMNPLPQTKSMGRSPAWSIA